MKKLLLYTALLATALPAAADEFHYNNILIGDRASGMGGAYTAISDDPSGMYYNPAGIVYAMGNNLSASVNAYHVLEKTYRKVPVGYDSKQVYYADWKRTSSSLLPNFFGILQSLGKVKVGFSYAVPDSTIERQDQVFHYGDGLGTALSYDQEYTVNQFGPSAAMEVGENLSVGMSLYVHKRNTTSILNQRLMKNEDGDTLITSWNNPYVRIDEWGVRPVLGVMWAPAEKVSVGLSASKIYVVSSSVHRQTDYFEPGGGFFYDLKSDENRDYPYQFSAGAAWFPSTSLLLSADVSYYTPTSWQSRVFYLSDFLEHEIKVHRRAVVNGAVGAEYYLTPEWAVRSGLFTDFANTPEVVRGQTGQAEHIDMFGGSFTISHFTRKTSLTAGGSYMLGTGHAQLSGRADQIQSASARSWTIFVSSSYSY